MGGSVAARAGERDGSSCRRRGFVLSRAPARRPRRLEALEGLRGGGHLQAEARHEDEVSMGAEGDQPVAIEGAQSGDTIRIEACIREGGLRIGEVALAEDVVGLEAIEAAIERIAGGGWERVVEAH